MSEETITEEKKSDVAQDLSKDAQTVIDMVEKMTVLDLSNLVKALEDKFGVVAAAPAAAVSVAAGDAGDSEEAGAATVSVILSDCGDKKIQVFFFDNLYNTACLYILF